MATKQTKTKIEKRTISYIALGVVILVILALAVWHFTASGAPKVSSQNHYTVPVSSPGVSQTSGNATCPCLSSQQIESMVNESALESQLGDYNTSTTSNSSIIAHYTPVNFSGSISTLWIASYRDFNSSEADELVAQSDNAAGLYGIAINGSSRVYNSTFTRGGEENGLMYSNLTLVHVGPGLDNVTTFYLLYGYKGGYVISFNFITRNRVNPNSSVIASEISPTI